MESQKQLQMVSAQMPGNSQNIDFNVKPIQNVDQQLQTLQKLRIDATGEPKSLCVSRNIYFISDRDTQEVIMEIRGNYSNCVNDYLCCNDKHLVWEKTQSDHINQNSTIYKSQIKQENKCLYGLSLAGWCCACWYITWGFFAPNIFERNQVLSSQGGKYKLKSKIPFNLLDCFYQKIQDGEGDHEIKNCTCSKPTCCSLLCYCCQAPSKSFSIQREKQVKYGCCVYNTIWNLDFPSELTPQEKTQYINDIILLEKELWK